MRFYLLDNPAPPVRYAWFAAVGTWSDGYICDVCGVSTERAAEPLQIEWQEGIDRIGDFSWGSYTCVVIETVRAFLKKNAFEVKFGRVEVLPPSVRPKRPQRPRVSFPYRGPHLSWLIPTARLPVDEARSGVHLESDCPKCKQKRHHFKRDGLVVRKGAWSGQKLFCVEQFDPSPATFITEDGLSMLQRERFSNLCPRPAGQIET